MKHLTIRQRVLLWYAAILVLMCALVVGALHFTSRFEVKIFVADTLQRALADTEREIRWRDGALSFDDDLEDIDYANVRIYSADGKRLLYGRIPTFDLPFSQEEARRVTDDNGQILYVQDRLYNAGHATQVWIRCTLSLDSLEFLRSNSIGVFLMLLLPLIGLGLLGGHLITRRAFLPLRRITNTARSIVDGDDLSRRIALPGNGEFARLSATFDAMFERLQGAFRREKQFTSDVSHELRTPLAVISSQCEYALQHPEEQAESLQTIHEQSRRMSALLNQLLMLSRMDSHRQALHMERLDLAFLAQTVAEELAPQAEEKQISLQTELEEDLYILADETMMLRFLINLLSNAIRFGREGGYARICLRREGSWVVGQVSDDGVGISRADLPHIFERFYQADPSRSQREGGSGLGLSMAQWIVQAHGGILRAESTLGEGSVFSFTFPYQAI